MAYTIADKVHVCTPYVAEVQYVRGAPHEDAETNGVCSQGTLIAREIAWQAMGRPRITTLDGRLIGTI